MTEICLEDVKSYLRILDNSEDGQLELLLDSAVEYIVSHTGLNEGVVRTKNDIRTALLVTSTGIEIIKLEINIIIS